MTSVIGFVWEFRKKIQEDKYLGSGLYANSVLLGQHVLLFGVRCLRSPSALTPLLFAYIPLVIVLVTLPKDFISRAAWSCKFCLVNSRFDPIVLS